MVGKTKKVVAGLALVLGLSGCGHPFGDGITSGYVTSKKYTAAYDQDVYSDVCYSWDYNSNPPRCTLSMRTKTGSNHYPPQYRIYLKDGDKVGWVDTDPETYYNVHEGNHFPDLR